MNQPQSVERVVASIDCEDTKIGGGVNTVNFVRVAVAHEGYPQQHEGWALTEGPRGVLATRGSDVEMIPWGRVKLVRYAKPEEKRK